MSMGLRVRRMAWKWLRPLMLSADMRRQGHRSAARNNVEDSKASERFWGSGLCVYAYMYPKVSTARDKYMLTCVLISSSSRSYADLTDAPFRFGGYDFFSHCVAWYRMYGG